MIVVLLINKQDQTDSQIVGWQVGNIS